MTREVWKPIPSLPGYLASSEGRLMRIPYEAKMPHGGTRVYGGEPTMGQWDGERYILHFRGKTYKVHRLICEAFSGAAPFAGAVVMHLDENSRNNRPENLKWGTQKENLNAPGFVAYTRARFAKLTPKQVFEIRERRKGGETLVAIAERFGIAQQTVSAIALRKSWDIDPPGDRP